MQPRSITLQTPSTEHKLSFVHQLCWRLFCADCARLYNISVLTRSTKVWCYLGDLPEQAVQKKTAHRASPSSAEVQRAPRREGRLASRKVDVTCPCSAGTGGGRASTSSASPALLGDAWLRLALSSVSIAVSMKCCLSWPASWTQGSASNNVGRCLTAEFIRYRRRGVGRRQRTPLKLVRCLEKGTADELENPQLHL